MSEFSYSEIQDNMVGVIQKMMKARSVSENGVVTVLISTNYNVGHI